MTRCRPGVRLIPAELERLTLTPTRTPSPTEHIAFPPLIAARLQQHKQASSWRRFSARHQTGFLQIHFLVSHQLFFLAGFSVFLFCASVPVCIPHVNT